MSKDNVNEQVHSEGGRFRPKVQANTAYVLTAALPKGRVMQSYHGHGAGRSPYGHDRGQSPSETKAAA
jgi:hypothetical protein